jgi:hypothetical protein
MKLSTFAIITAVLGFGFGLALVLVPEKFIGMYGMDMNTGGILMARYLGGANFFLAMIFWSYSHVAPTAKSWPKLLWFSFIYFIIQLGITLLEISKDGANAMGWTTAALFALLAIGSIYFLSRSSKAAA